MRSSGVPVGSLGSGQRPATAYRQLQHASAWLAHSCVWRSQSPYKHHDAETYQRHSRQLQCPAAAEAACTAAAAAVGPSLLGGSFALPQLVPASGPWGVWSGLICAGAFGLWSERTRLGKELSGALVATLAGEKSGFQKT